MDDRRVRPIAQLSGNRSKKPPAMATLGTMLMSAVMGIVFLFAFMLGEDPVTHLTFYFSFFFIFLSLVLITDFTSVLIDVRDNFILLPKPVSDKTIVFARLLHIFIHICKIVVPMGLPAVVLVGIRYNILGSVILLPLIFLLAGFSIFFINAVYIAILKVTTPQRFQAIITYVQIGFAIVMYASYQIIPRMIARLAGDEFRLGDFAAIRFLPLYWMASSWHVLFQLGGSRTAVFLAAAGILFPLLCMGVVVKYLAPSFNRKLSLLSAGDTRPRKKTIIRQEKKSYIERWARLLTTNHTEKAGFLFTWKMMGRSREFKMKVYPAIGYILVYVVFIFFSNKNINLAQLWDADSDVKMILLSALYLSVFLVIMAVNQVVYSEKYKASWIFYTSPVASPGQIVLGTVKAVLLKFYFPVAVIISTIALAFIGLQILPNLVLALTNVVLIIVLMMYGKSHYLPFSTSQSNEAKTGNFLKGIFIFIVSGVVAFGHFLISSMTVVVLIASILSMACTWYILGSVRQMTWQKILSAYTED
jgi:hypothetical protein